MAQRWFLRSLNFLRLRGRTKRCGDFYLDEPPPDIGVREPRRPRPSAPGGAALLDSRRRTSAGTREYHAMIRKACTGCGCDQCPCPDCAKK